MDSTIYYIVLAVCVNIASVPDCAELISQELGLKFLLDRAIMYHDPLLLKLVRNLSYHQQLQEPLLVSMTTHTCTRHYITCHVKKGLMCP